MICRWHFLSSRPLPGVLISLPTFDFQDKWNNGSRPLPGVLISLHLWRVLWTNRIRVLVPFPGFLYLYAEKLRDAIAWERVLVPFPGFLYLYDISDYLDEYWGWFSSPSRGSYISTKMNNVTLIGRLFSSPSRGSYISTLSIQTYKVMKCSRPLPGVLISLPCPRNPLNYIRIFLLLRRKCNSIPYTDLIPHKIQDNVLFSTMRGKTGRYWEQWI